MEVPLYIKLSLGCLLAMRGVCSFRCLLPREGGALSALLPNG